MQNELLKFDDLVFGPHPMGGKKARLFFPNGRGVSVVQFNGSYTSGPDEWELAVLSGNSNDWHLDYESGITDDVMGHLSADEVSGVMRQVQELPAYSLPVPQ